MRIAGFVLILINPNQFIGEGGYQVEHTHTLSLSSLSLSISPLTQIEMLL